MTDNYRALAEQITRDLELDTPPIQVSYLDRPPEGVREHAGQVPSVCTFFAKGKDGAFYAGLPAHENCEIGAYVLGIQPEGEVGQRLMSTIGMMEKEGYLGAGEAGKVPHNAKAPRYVAYGPLGELEAPPTGVLLFARPKSAMLAMEAASGFQMPVTGRPMCAIMPMLNQGAPVSMSMGCIGSRVYTSMGDDKMVVGIRGDHLAKFAEDVRRIRHANAVVEAEDRRRKETTH
jgi:uncharacterized protein (DUF169 family)